MAYHACPIVIIIRFTADPIIITSLQPIYNFLELIIIGTWIRCVKNVTKIDTRNLVLLRNARNKILWLSYTSVSLQGS